MAKRADDVAHRTADTKRTKIPRSTPAALQPSASEQDVLGLCLRHEQQEREPGVGNADVGLLPGAMNAQAETPGCPKRSARRPGPSSENFGAFAAERREHCYSENRIRAAVDDADRHSPALEGRRQREAGRTGADDEHIAGTGRWGRLGVRHGDRSSTVRVMICLVPCLVHFLDSMPDPVGRFSSPLGRARSIWPFGAGIGVAGKHKDAHGHRSSSKSPSIDEIGAPLDDAEVRRSGADCSGGRPALARKVVGSSARLAHVGADSRVDLRQTNAISEEELTEVTVLSTGSIAHPREDHGLARSSPSYGQSRRPVP